jgi:predicted DNA-binding transcriptional regulator AlpA
MTIQTQNNGFLRAQGTANYLSISKAGVWLFAKQGLLHPIKLSPRVTVFTIDDLDAFIASRRAV